MQTGHTPPRILPMLVGVRCLYSGTIVSMPVVPENLALLIYPSPELRRKAEPVPEVTELVRAVASKMIEIMRQHDGIGLAAPQVGLPWRLFVTHVPPGEKRTLED